MLIISTFLNKFKFVFFYSNFLLTQVPSWNKLSVRLHKHKQIKTLIANWNTRNLINFHIFKKNIQRCIFFIIAPLPLQGRIDFRCSLVGKNEKLDIHWKVKIGKISHKNKRRKYKKKIKNSAVLKKFSKF